MSADVAIRRLGSADAEAFLALRERSLREHPEAYNSNPEDWALPLDEAVRRLEENVVFAAEASGRLIGQAVLALAARSRAKQRHKAEVWAVYVAREWSGRGVARRLMEAVIAEARRRGLEALVLTVNADNPSARHLYESLGFRSYGLERRALLLPDGRAFDDVLMQLDLVPRT